MNSGASWKTKVSQIECYNTGKAPTDCDQYFTGVGNTFNSYNFGIVSLQGTQTNYCFRRESGKLSLS